MSELSNKDHRLSQIRLWVINGVIDMEDLQYLYGEFYAEQEAKTARVEQWEASLHG